jgi:hypothetical protein
VTVTARVAGRQIASWLLTSQSFEEHAASLAADLTAGPEEVLVSTETGTFTALHYWVYAPR